LSGGFFECVEIIRCLVFSNMASLLSRGFRVNVMKNKVRTRTSTQLIATSIAAQYLLRSI
jgi:hypothetical protein